MHPTPLSRLATLVLVAGLALPGCTTMNGGMAGTAAPMSREALMAHTSGWSQASRMAVTAMTETYGAPDAVTATTAMWGPTGPWKRTVVYSTEVPHEFPGSHTDVMEQFVDYRVPPDMFDELAAYDGSVVVQRTNGEISARCDLEAANVLALNLADQIVRGQRTVAEARAEYGRQIMAFKAGQPAPLAERLAFTPAATGTADPDRPLMSGGQ
ncbi:MAG TPA: hypothetical protein VF576_11645 [Rubricoccaceae bacterium]